MFIRWFECVCVCACDGIFSICIGLAWIYFAAAATVAAAVCIAPSLEIYAFRRYSIVDKINICSTYTNVFVYVQYAGYGEYYVCEYIKYKLYAAAAAAVTVAVAELFIVVAIGECNLE